MNVLLNQIVSFRKLAERISPGATPGGFVCPWQEHNLHITNPNGGQSPLSPPIVLYCTIHPSPLQYKTTNKYQYKPKAMSKNNDTATEGAGDDEECVEVRLKASDFDRISAAYEVDVITREETKRPTFPIPIQVDRVFGYTEELQELLEEGNIRAIDHGEFQQCVDKLVSICGEVIRVQIEEKWFACSVVGEGGKHSWRRLSPLS